MKGKAKKFRVRWKYNPLTRATTKSTINFLQAALRAQRHYRPSPELRAALGLVQWMHAEHIQQKNRVAIQSSCILTGRNRGTAQRFGISRLKLKELARTGLLLGLQKQQGWK